MGVKAWEGWYHCTVSTYGTWLPGDPRGWRERDHHEHVAGDYKRPPEVTNFSRGRWEHSKQVMREDPYYFEAADRERVGRLLLDHFGHQGVAVAALTVCRSNIHVLLRKRDGEVKRTLGMAKRHVTFEFAPVVEGNRRRRIWEGEGGVKPIRDLAHGRNAFAYILDHVKEGGWVWFFGIGAGGRAHGPRRRRRRAFEG